MGMIPDKLWQYFEDGMLEQFGSDKSNFLNNPRDEYDADGKHVAVFKMISKKLSRKYFWTFVACEMLNVVIGIVSFLCIFLLTERTFLITIRDIKKEKRIQCVPSFQQ